MQSLKRYYKIIAVPLFEDNYSYVVQGTAPKSLVLVDPANPSVVLSFLQRSFPSHHVSHVLYTHKHWDHAGGSQQLYEKLKLNNPNIQMVIGQNDRNFVKGANYSLKANEELKIGECRVKILHVPCHTRGHTIYNFLPLQKHEVNEQIEIQKFTIEGKTIRVFDSNDCTFTGDTLFVGGIGRFFEGQAKEMVQNIEKMLNTINEDSELFVGHQYAISNLKWSKEVEKNNEDIQKQLDKLLLQQLQENEICSIPSSLRREKLINVFVRTVSGSPLLTQLKKNSIELMTTLRSLKNENKTSL